jgi:hypothetical protein
MPQAYCSRYKGIGDTIVQLRGQVCFGLIGTATRRGVVSTMPKGLSPLNWFDDFLYLPEVLYVLFFIWLICSGPAKFSVHYWLAGKLWR